MAGEEKNEEKDILTLEETVNAFGMLLGLTEQKGVLVVRKDTSLIIDELVPDSQVEKGTTKKLSKKSSEPIEDSVMRVLDATASIWQKLLQYTNHTQNLDSELKRIAENARDEIRRVSEDVFSDYNYHIDRKWTWKNKD